MATAFRGHAGTGDVLRFRWNFLSADAVAGDCAFVVIDGQLTKLADLDQAPLALAGWGRQSGYAEFNHTFAGSGPHQLVFGVVDVGDYNATSALLIDSVVVSSVPEPQAVVLMLVGLGILSRMRRR